MIEHSKALAILNCKMEELIAAGIIISYNVIEDYYKNELMYIVLKVQYPSTSIHSNVTLAINKDYVILDWIFGECNE